MAGLCLVAPIVACSGAPRFDRERAIADVMASDPRLDRTQAACYVDRVFDELGAEALAAKGDVAPEQVMRITRIRVDCIGVNNLGTSPPTAPPATAAPPEPSTDPERPGDDPVLDALYDACVTGDGAACDTLFDRSPVGSEYEEIASTCGGRTKELRCADVYLSSTSTTTSQLGP